MKKSWFEEAWSDYEYWQTEDRKTLKKINNLLKDIERNGELKGTGSPEALKGNLSGLFSRHIDKENRLVYRIENSILEIISCKGHYE